MKKRKFSEIIFKSIKTRMTVVFVITTLLMSITSVFILITSKDLVEKMDDMFSANVKMEEFLSAMDDVDSNLTKYLVMDDSDSLLNYYKFKDIFSMKAQSMFDASQGIYSQDDLIYKDIVYMVESYLKETDEAVEAKRLDEADKYIAGYAEAEEIAGYINTYADRLNLSKLDLNTTQYLDMSDDLNNLQNTNIVLIISVICMNVLVVSHMTYNMNKPIVTLAKSAREISKGNFNAPDINVSSQDELGVMADAFNNMKHSIKTYIAELHDKADTESKLLEQQIENLKFKTLLADAEMKALQMQINPHFLFNTLNAGVQLAMLEGAERTSGFLDDIAKIFRYNVKSLNRKVKLREEIDTVRAYGNLFRVRFGDIIRFDYDIDLKLLELDVPPLIIQPLVENATIHGIGDLERGGMVKISLEREGNNAFISIEDNGIGMSEEVRQKILSCYSFESEKSGHTTGIGVSNVVQRMRLFFGVQDVIKIESKTGEGTTVTLKIPYPNDELAKDGDMNVQSHGVR
jgi:two-component system sensor histidine kinase YesM